MKQKNVCRKCLGWVVLILLNLAILSPQVWHLLPTRNSLPARIGPTTAQHYGALPLSFEANRGQTDPAVKFLARGPGYNLFLTANEAVLKVRATEGNKQPTTPSAQTLAARVKRGLPQTKSAVVRMKLIGANPQARGAGQEELPGRSNYLIGPDPRQWRTDIPAYSRVRFDEVYPGISLVYYGRQNQLEYDLIAAPGSDPGRIKLGFAGAERVEIAANGELVLQTVAGELR